FPDSPGVYLMKGGAGEIIYIGKATSLKSRVGSYFTRALDNKTAKLVSEIEEIAFRKTDSVVEALILECNLVGKYQPKYNIKLKDDKSFANILITDEKYPRVLIVRPTDREKIKARRIFGPYTSKLEAQMAIDLIVKIFGHDGRNRDTSSLYRSYYIKGYASGKIGDIPKEEYMKIIGNIKLFLEGKKDRIIGKLEKEMNTEAKKMNFEKAAEIRNRVFALKHISDVAFIKGDGIRKKRDVKFPGRAEAYDISDISGDLAVGSMVVFSSGEQNRSEYRKFKIKTVKGANDVAMLKEVFRRRFAHNEWAKPDLVIIDGGQGQKNVAQVIFKEYKLDIPIVAIAKGQDRKGEKLFFSAPKGYIFPDVGFIKRMRDEAHRFAISYHRKLRKIKK
ncbi:MAG: UvrB/UvrC motif-containing protein, partial [Minisyncoccia bacterium]